MSDSHGRAGIVRRAVDVLERAGAEAFVHCGDVGGIDVLCEVAGRRCWFVWGNMDYPDAATRAFVASVGLPEPSTPIRFDLAGKRIVVCHGHEREFRGLLEQDGEIDYLLHGHTHRRADRRVGSMRVINPGGLYRVARPTVALLDLPSDELRFLDVPRSP